MYNRDIQILVLWLLFFLPVGEGISQLPDYHVQVFDERYGLRTDVDRVIRDKNGFLWLQYDDRVQRFDGKNVEEFIIGDGLISIYCDRDNQIWLSNNDVVFKFVNEHIGFNKIDVDSVEKRTIGNLIQLPGEEMMIVTSAGLYEYHPSQKKFIPVEKDDFIVRTPVNIRRLCSKLYETTLFYCSRDTIWAQDMSSGSKLGLRLESVSGVFPLNSYQTIVSTWMSQAFFCDFEKQTITNIQPSKFLEDSKDDFLTVSAVANLSEHNHLLSTSKGMVEFNSSSEYFSKVILYYKGQPLMNVGRLIDLYLDDHRKLWVSSEDRLTTFDPFNSGMGLIRNADFDTTKTFSNQVRGFVPDEKENLWLATSNGIVYWDVQKNNFKSLYAVEGATDQMNHPSIRGLEYDGENIIIGQTNRGIWLYNPVTKKYRRPIYESGLRGDTVRRRLERDFVDQIYKLHNGDHFIVARDRGYLLEARTYLVTLVDFPGARENLNFCYQDKQKQIWIGTHKGLHCLDSNLVFKFSIREGFGTGITRCLLQLAENEYVFGARGLFLIKVNDGVVTTSVLSPHFQNIYIQAIYRNKSGEFWITTDEGLFRFNMETGFVESLDQFDNIQGDLFTPNSFYVSSKGVLFLGGTNGINYFEPDKINIRNDSVKVSLLRVIVNEDDTSYYDRSALLSLKPSQNFIEVNYVAPYYGNTSRLQYRYKLEGVSSAWNNVGNNTTIRFTSLSPGDYRFNVAASLNGKDWFECSETLAFSIAFPFYQEWWFVTGCFLLVSGLIFYFVKKRIRVIQEKEKVKRDYERRIAEVEMHALRAQMNPHFMFNSLNSINNFILKNDPDNASGYLTKFSRLMRLILDNSRSEWIVLENELKALELYIDLEVVRFDNVFEYEIIVSPEIDVTTTYVPPMIIQPYVENAIWHGLLHRKEPGGKLCIRLWRESDQLHISIEDNGVGRDEARRLKSKSATKHKSHGMKITAERIEIVNRVYNVNARVQIDDLPGTNGHVNGTKVSLTLQDKMYDSHHRR